MISTRDMELTVEAKIRALTHRLKNIAQKNKDEFSFRIEIELPRTIEPTCKYRFVCLETAESHEFTSGIGKTIEEAVDNATSGLPEALKQWGYKDAK